MEQTARLERKPRAKRGLKELLAALYKLEVNVSLTSFYDANWDLLIGDKMNGYTDIYRDLTLDEVDAVLRQVLKGY